MRDLKRLLVALVTVVGLGLVGATAASAQVQFIASSSGARPIRVEGMTEATGTIVLAANTAGVIVSGSTIACDYGTAVLDCSGAVAFNGGNTSGFLTKSCSGNVVTLSFISNQAFVPGDSLTVSGVRVNANALGTGNNVNVAVTASVPAANQVTNPITLIVFTTLTVATVQAKAITVKFNTE
ncbi:MAG: hypothetical protein A3H28_09215 [Acidobacteria bacterium RIFCSPLOWO2_02_FULL_61_28]|nr:MAG: hypothetical protein A3H28_09215 [Acidobacteria bacterium RIFCSPLOWO2_02_FULL_61_28]